MTVTVSPTDPSSARTMSAWSWVTTALGIVGLVVCLNLLVAWNLDIFGVLRDPRGRSLPTSHRERKAKYLLNFNYVPENFDALIIGASASANWQLTGLQQYRFYNESLLGGNATEQRMLVEKALERGHFKLVLVGLSPGITERHDLRDGLDQVDPHEALGSLYSYVIMLDRLRESLLHRQSQFYPDGSSELPTHVFVPPDPNVPVTPFEIDPKAAEDYRILVQELMRRGVRVIYIVAPHYGLDTRGAGQTFDAYTRAMLSILPPAPLIDLDDDRYAALRSPENMIDDDHLSRAGALIFSKIVVERIREVLQDR